jgi:hypothetical protein
MKKQLALLAFAAALLPNAARAQADPGWVDWKEVHSTVGVRFWRTTWTTCTTCSSTTRRPRRRRNSRSRAFATRNSWSRAATCRARLHIPDLATFERKEYDVNFGYFILPAWRRPSATSTCEYAERVGYDWTTQGLTVGLTEARPFRRRSASTATWPTGARSSTTACVYRPEGQVFPDRARLGVPARGHERLARSASSSPRAIATSAWGRSEQPATSTPSTIYEYTQGPVLGVRTRSRDRG